MSTRMTLPTILLLSLAFAAHILADSPPAAESESCEVYNENDLRLAGASPDAGRVEVFHDGKWGTLCGKPSMSISSVLCSQLGFGRAIGIFTIAPKVETQNWISDIQCKGDESSIFECGHSMWGSGSGCGETSPPIAVRCEAAGLDGEIKIPISDLQLPGVDPITVLDPYTAPASKATKDCNVEDYASQFSKSHLPSFVHKSKIEPWLESRTERVRDVLCQDAKVTSSLDDFGELGLRWNQFGFDFEGTNAESLYPNRSSVIEDPRADVIRDGYLSPNAKVFWSLDHQARYPASAPEMSAASREIFANLSRDGFVKIDDFGLDMEALDKTADWALNQREYKNITVVLDDGSCVVARLDVPALKPLITNETVNAAIRGYLGQDSVLHGYKILRLSARLKGADNYIAADWHHDRAGRRLKLFVFLHDVANEGGRPTEIANGTHNIVYYSFEDYATSRYDDAYVQKKFDIHRLGGKRGGGFIFDTNAIHRGSPTGDHKRETIILEYHNSYKCPAIHSLGMNVPCPSGDQFMVATKI
mmetsp:Transcript_13393/g.20048  ORF Transcript_13393/g.20048 Transcript_13393/m.20048 type:complete len:533 (-) Transcript_13393:92-1690(-)